MFAKELEYEDIEKIGPIVESLLKSEKLTDDEKWAVDQSWRAAVDLLRIRHSETAKAFYARSDIESRTAKSITAWIASNPDTPPGTVTMICGREHVASYDSCGKLNLYPVRDL